MLLHSPGITVTSRHRDICTVGNVTHSVTPSTNHIRSRRHNINRSLQQPHRLKSPVWLGLRAHRQQPSREGADKANEKVVIIREPASRDALLPDIAAELSGLPPNRVRELIDLGAVYYGDPLLPNEPPKWRRARTLGEAALQLPLLKGQWVRVHPNPKRYPVAQSADWAARVIHLDDDICVINKPAGIPVQSHESNSAETVPRCVEGALGLNRLWMVHRLDWCTTGVLLMACNEQSATAFCRDMQEHKVKKQYKVLTWTPVEAGTELVHYMYDGPFGSELPVMGGKGLRARGPRLLSNTPQTSASREWKKCAAQILDSQEVSLDGVANAWLQNLVQPQTRSSSGDNFGEATDTSETAGPEHRSQDMIQLPARVYESTVNLSSGGRTHQIRAQLAAAGAPLIGDVMYGPISGATVGSSGVADPELVQLIERCEQIDGSIGLHAFSMVWDGTTFTCLPPWAES